MEVEIVTILYYCTFSLYNSHVTAEVKANLCTQDHLFESTLWPQRIVDAKGFKAMRQPDMKSFLLEGLSTGKLDGQRMNAETIAYMSLCMGWDGHEYLTCQNMT